MSAVISTPKSQQAAKLILSAAAAIKKDSTLRYSVELIAGGYAPSDVEASHKLPPGTLNKILFGGK